MVRYMDNHANVQTGGHNNESKLRSGQVQLVLHKLGYHTVEVAWSRLYYAEIFVQHRNRYQDLWLHHCSLSTMGDDASGGVCH
jgi:hypothetical protein